MYKPDNFKTYKVKAYWTMFAIVEVEANSMASAKEFVQDIDTLPPDGEYVNDSFRVE